MQKTSSFLQFIVTNMVSYQDMKRTKLSTSRPRISVIIPTKNEAKLLPLCLRSLKLQKTRVPFEVIVVDTNSTDKTQDIAKSFGARIIHQPRKGKVLAFRKGADSAKGTILCFTEADCILPPHWIETISTYFGKHSEVSAVCGIYTFHESSIPFKFMTYLGHSTGHLLHFLFFGHHSVRASNFAVRKTAYNAAGGFAKEQLELYDVEISQRLSLQGDVRVLPNLRIQTSDRRVRGRLLAYIGELVPALTALLLRKPLAKQTYKDIR